MTSLLSYPAQINARYMYLKSIGSAREYTATRTVNSVMTTTEWAAATTNASGTSNVQYRDMGKRVTVVNPITGIEVERYSQVQLVNGPISEGVPASYGATIFVLTWSANGATVVNVARVG
jgi:hypothetical protein